MSESRVVNPEVERLEISNGDFLLVKKRLSAGDQQDGFERSYLKNPDGSYVTRPDGGLVVSPSGIKMALITSYLVDWSLLGLDGKPLDLRGVGVDLKLKESMLRALDPESYREIHAAIEAHDTKMAKERMAQKKIPAGDETSSATSPLPPALVGATSG